MNKMTAFALCALCSTTIAVFVGCDIDQTKEARLPDVDVDADAGNLPEYEIKKTEEGRLPSVDVDVSGGQLPEYDVEMADVDVGTTTETVKVPKVKVVVEEEEVEVPYVDVDMPDDKAEGPKVKQTITATVKTPSPGYKLEIDRAYLIDDEIAVISTLVKTDSSKKGSEGVASDSIVINAPKTDIEHYVLTGTDEVEGLNGDYTFGSSFEDMDVDLEDARLLYSRDES